MTLRRKLLPIRGGGPLSNLVSYATLTTTILKQIVWPHELVYDPSGKPAVYDELSLPLFIQGYLVILQAERLQQKEAML